MFGMVIAITGINDAGYSSKPWPFPNRHFFLQFIHNPLTCLKAFPSMWARHLQKK
jgi:hypothetical protein